MKDQKEWEKVRFATWGAMVGSHMKKPPKSPQKVMELPLVDKRETDREKANIEWLKSLKRSTRAGS